MSDRMTSICLPGGSADSGWADYGRKTIPEMLALVRRRAREMRANAEAVLAAADDDFRVATYVGVFRRKDYTVLQEGKETAAEVASKARDQIAHAPNPAPAIP